MEFIRAHPEHDDVLVTHYLAIWDSYGTPPENLRPESEELVRSFLKSGREDHRLASFIAFDGNIAVGSVSCRLNAKAYPTVLKPERSLERYIWSVYTDATHRGQGIAKKLVTMAIGYLEEIGCTSVVLHSSEAGTTRSSTVSATRSKICSPSSKIDGALRRATTDVLTPFSRQSASQQPSSSGFDQ